MENQTIQTPMQGEIPNQPSKRFSVLSIVLIFIALLLLSSTVFLAYQNVQLQKQITSLKAVSFDTSQSVLDQNVSVTPPVDQNQQDNNWRMYKGETFSFQYPNGWPDLVVNQLSTRKQFVAEGVFEMDVGSYFASKQGRPLSFQEYREQILQSESRGQEVDYSLSGLKGVRFFGVDKNGEIFERVILASGTDDVFIYNLTYFSHEKDLNLSNSVFNPILATFKFK